MSDINESISSGLTQLSSSDFSASKVIFSLAIIGGFVTLGTAIKFEWPSRSLFKRIFLCVLVILQVLLLSFLLFSSDRIVLISGFAFSYVLELVFLQIYAQVTSKWVHDGLSRNGMLAQPLDGLYKFSMRALGIGFLIILISLITGFNLIPLGQICSFVSWCTWLHFLNKIRLSQASPRIIRRMFWANILTMITQIIIMFVLIILVISGISTPDVGREGKGNSEALIFVLAVVAALDHTLRISLTGYFPWDSCYLSRHQFLDEQRMIRDPQVELEEDAPEYDDGL
jgi:hypothetical protein